MMAVCVGRKKGFGKNICQRSPMTQWSEQKFATVSSISIRATGFFLFILDNVTTLMGLLKP